MDSHYHILYINIFNTFLNSGDHYSICVAFNICSFHLVHIVGASLDNLLKYTKFFSILVDNLHAFKIRKISLLGNISEDFVKSFAINLDSAQLNPKFRGELVKLLKAYPGKTALSVFLFDAKSGYRVELASKKFNVLVCADFLAGLEHLGISYSINK